MSSFKITPSARFWLRPQVDRACAILLALLGFYQLFVALHTASGVGMVCTLLVGVTHNAFLLIRTPASFLDSRLHVWVLCLVSSHWHLVLGMAVDGMEPSGGRLAAIFSLSGVLLYLYARLGLARSFGVLPAVRKIQTAWAYRWLRHPMYLACFFLWIGTLVQHPRFIVLCTVMIGMGLVLVRIYWEERILSKLDAFAVYRQRVPYRLVPGLW